MPKPVRISLANKCQLLFGAAVVLILTAALAVGWLRMNTLVAEGQQETARKLANAWLNGKIELGSAITPADDAISPQGMEQGLTLSLIRKDEMDLMAADPFLAQAIERFQTRGERDEAFVADRDGKGQRVYRFARAIRKSDLSRIRGGAAAGFAPTIDATAFADPLEMVLLLQLHADMAERQLLLNRIYIVAAGLIAGLFAIALFWFITTRIILSPVRVLRDTAQRIAEGDLNSRADVNTGDEFQQLSETFNQMVTNLKNTQDQLRTTNKSLDLKLDQLAQSNVALYEANKVKGEFLANVSHELRTPLHSIVGFAEVLEETLKDRTGPVDDKRKRYIGNIIGSSRRLLDLINDLLDLAKIEAGRMEVRIAALSVADTLEGLVNLLRPQAEKQQIALLLTAPPNIPMVHTDAGKFQQVLFNFLSNAMKFTPAQGRITVQAAMIEEEFPGGEKRPAVQVSVSDTGPGIAPQLQEKIFEKFTQLDQTVTREHMGTGLGLAISRELARLLQGHIDLKSEPGKGATFSLIIPVAFPQRAAPLMPQEPRPTVAAV
ncbi:MAG: HAMP domain-containing sensor histidine kinase [Phycisphaeraceae bacterium]